MENKYNQICQYVETYLSNYYYLIENSKLTQDFIQNGETKQNACRNSLAITLMLWLEISNVALN